MSRSAHSKVRTTSFLQALSCIKVLASCRTAVKLVRRHAIHLQAMSSEWVRRYTGVGDEMSIAGIADAA